MKCDEFWNEMPELERDSTRLGHVQECPSCAGLLADQRALAAGLRRLSQENGRLEAPARVQAKLLEAFRGETAGRAGLAVRRRPIAWRMWVPAAAAVIALAFVLVRSHEPGVPQSRKIASIPMALDIAGDDSATLGSDFIPAPYAVAGSPPEETDWVRLEVPRSALVALGLPVAVDGGPGRVEAEVALNPEGVVQGVRLLQ